jgi:hypothetical protein
MMARHPHDRGWVRHDPGPLDFGVARRAALHADLAYAGDLLERDPDAAALLLDGLLQRVGAEWFLARDLPVPPAERLLERLGSACEPFAWRLRLALRAPDVHARFVAVLQCLDLTHE